MRIVIASILGVVFGGLFIVFGEIVGHTLFPSTMEFPSDPALWDEYLKQVPFMAMVMIVISWGFGAFVAGIISTWIQGRTNYRPMLISVAILQVFAYLNMLSFTHPKWMWITATFEFIPIGFIAYFIIRKKKTA